MTTVHVDVAGGALAVEQLAGSSEPVLAIHGISSQRRLWNWLHAAAPEISLVAPDLRGRAGSVGVQGPSSVGQHVADLVAVLDALEIGAAHVVGMSMGGFVGVELAARHADRVKSLVLIDGGPPVAPPDGLTPELLPVVFADRLGRLEKEWDSLDDYLAFFTAGTAPLLDTNDPLLRDYLELDLEDGRVRLSGEALLRDAHDIFFNPSAFDSVTVPMRMLYAEWGTGPDTAPLYTHEAVEGFRDRLASVRFGAGMDHASSIMSKAGGDATVAMILEALA